MNLENMDIEKATDRCKQLIKPEHACWIGISNQIAIKTVLQEAKEKKIHIRLEQQYKKEYLDLRAELEKKDKEIKSYENAIHDEIIENKDKEMAKDEEISKLNKIIDEMAEYMNLLSDELIAETGINDLKFCELEACTNNPEIDCEDCIKDYFTKKCEGK